MAPRSFPHTLDIRAFGFKDIYPAIILGTTVFKSAGVTRRNASRDARGLAFRRFALRIHGLFTLLYALDIG
jgi:hypothetical protein